MIVNIDKMLKNQNNIKRITRLQPKRLGRLTDLERETEVVRVDFETRELLRTISKTINSLVRDIGILLQIIREQPNDH